MKEYYFTLRINVDFTKSIAKKDKISKHTFVLQNEISVLFYFVFAFTFANLINTAEEIAFRF